MDWVFYVSGAVAVLATIMVITEPNAVHALLYLIVSLLAVAVIFYVLGAPFVAALEVIIYAGAIVVLFLFIIMILNLAPGTTRREMTLFSVRAWLGPAILAAILFAEVVLVFPGISGQLTTGEMVEPPRVGLALFGPYLLGTELASLLLLAGLVGAYHLGRREHDWGDDGEVR